MKKDGISVGKIDGQRLRKFALRKREGARGTDGWSVAELSVLPADAWDFVAEIFDMIEASGQWPLWAVVWNCRRIAETNAQSI